MNTVFWLCAFVVFLIIEAVTASLVSVWFAVGALAAAFCTYLGMDTTGCLIVFLVVSAIVLGIFKKFYNKKITTKHEPTNADRLIGEKGIVENDIEPISGVGVVKIKGNLWSAASHEPIEKGSVVEVKKIEGVKLIVEKVECE